MLKESYDKDDMDSRNSKATAWQILHSYYCSVEPLPLKLSPSAANTLIGHSVEVSILKKYDELAIDEFKKVLILRQAMYKDACNKKTMSGFYRDFGTCIGGKVYLLYLHHCLMETGNKALMLCACSTLDNRLKCDSMEPFMSLGHPNRSPQSGVFLLY